ncbi:class I SAM-dependent methyltransferase [Pseudofulvimonas gallinarii]|jgi:SAM-dependent MidA family methyltransferase|uniref:SAM-dependent MidA family methyltransferase n=1 Tax=Pseudofulvimonas gallinarii TaxID=634155 RepID=A0A4R3LH78_9GAMM|nr:SAM-dependent methyltransferase [Pseudofulvimonas gallinarii]TCS98858.1 SAM-dependent MidA family methyltransferase [Pseudofulvimonas gallinarii]THD14340.1 hypothetical protein B1808_03505 [Pseudofulvimonas gallinarii]
MSARLPEPSAEALAHSRRLAGHVAAEIAARGPVPFSRFMELLLYAPGLGYYSAGSRKFGAEGDFVTAPELGPAFAHGLAHCLASAMAGDGDWDLLEAGGGSGALAADLLQALAARDALPRRYRLLEISADLRERQRGRIAARCPQWLDRVDWLDQPPRSPWRGAVVANEVIDALPATRFALRDDGLYEQFVGGGPERFEWLEQPASPALAAQIRKRLGDDLDALPRPYRSEIHLSLQPWLAALTGSLQQGLALFVDYGYPRPVYYSPERLDGTLVCHYRHHAHGDPLHLPGLQDITAFVDFTAVAEAALACGLDVAGYTSQAQFLLGNDIQGYLASLDALPFATRLNRVGAVKTLMLPGEMGERFQVMALSRRLDAARLHGFDADLRYQLQPR